MNYELDIAVTSSGKSAWESNPPTRLVTPFARFEDEDSHRTTCALAGSIASPIRLWVSFEHWLIAADGTNGGQNETMQRQKRRVVEYGDGTRRTYERS